jgi:DNA-binding IclR family transcriptional regulator
MANLSSNARRLLNVFARYKAKNLPFQTLTGRDGVGPEQFESAVAELIHEGLVEYPGHGIHYRLTVEGWTYLGSPAEIAFPEFP